MAKWVLDPEGMAVVERLRDHRLPELIERLSASDRIAALPYLAQMIPGQDKRVVEASLSAIDRLLRLLQPSDLRRLDQEIRTRWSYWSWVTNLTPKDVRKLVRRSGYPFAAAAVASMHRSGFVREEAVRHLAALRTGEELPFLLVRAADWVEQVRGAATRAIRDRLVTGYVPAFVDNLVLLEGDSFRTGRASGLLPAIEDLLGSDEAVPDLLRALTHLDRGVRRAAARRALRSGVRAPTLLAPALAQDDVVVAQVVARAAVEDASDEERGPLVERLSDHPFGGIRQIGLTARVRWFPGSAPDVLAEALFDRQAGVRGIAQQALAKEGMDVARRYGDALGEHPYIALLGLGETGTRSDASAAIPFVDSEQTKIRRAAVRAISLLDPAGHTDALLRALRDPSPAVSRTALQGLDRVRPPGIADALWAIVESGGHEHSRRHAVTLLTRGDRWTMLALGLRALAGESTDVKAAGHRLVAVCMATWNKSFTSPPTGSVRHLLDAVERARSSLTPSQVRDITFTLRGFM